MLPMLLYHSIHIAKYPNVNTHNGNLLHNTAYYPACHVCLSGHTMLNQAHPSMITSILLVLQGPTHHIRVIIMQYSFW